MYWYGIYRTYSSFDGQRCSSVRHSAYVASFHNRRFEYVRRFPYGPASATGAGTLPGIYVRAGCEHWFGDAVRRLPYVQMLAPAIRAVTRYGIYRTTYAGFDDQCSDLYGGYRTNGSFVNQRTLFLFFFVTALVGRRQRGRVGGEGGQPPTIVSVTVESTSRVGKHSYSSLTVPANRERL